LYRQVIDMADLPSPSLIALNARMGLAAVYESQDQFDQAAAEYAKVRQEAGANRTIALQAERQSKALGGLRQPVIFAQAPAVESPEKEPADTATPAEDAAAPSEPAPTPATP
jgi:hypothetical protein